MRRCLVSRACRTLAMTLAFATLPLIASAASITVGTAAIGMGICDPAQSKTETTVAVPLTQSIGNCFFLFGSGGHGTAEAQGVFAIDGLHLGVSALLEGQASTFAEAIAYFSDTVVPTGGTPGTSGFLDFAFTVDGSVFCTPIVCDNFDDRAFATLGIRLGAPPAFPGTTRISGSTLTNGTSTKTLEIPIVFGSPVEFTIGMRAVADMSGSRSALEFADFFNTASLTQVLSLDAQHNLIPDGGVTSASGLIYPTAVPEPATLLLVGGGIAVAIRRRAKVG